MKTHGISTTLLALTVLLVLVSCGGGGVGGSGIVSRGAISATDSIVVNGTAFDTAGAKVFIDGEERGTGDADVRRYLDAGMVVTVHGSEGNNADVAVADRIFYSSALKGPVSAKTEPDAGIYELTVMGQTVVVNHLTYLKDITLDEIIMDDVVEVSGFLDDEGTIWATFLAAIGTFDPDVTYAVTGFVHALDPGQKTFVVNGLEVDYANVGPGGLPDAALEDGMLVEATGTVNTAFTIMEAARIHLEDELEAEDAGEVKVTGFVTKVSAGDIMVGNQTVMIEEGAIFVDFGCEPEHCGDADILPGMKLEAEGELVDGILRVWEIEFWEPDQFEIEGWVTDFVSATEFTVQGQEVTTTLQTVFEDGEPSDLDNGVLVEIKGRRQGNKMEADKVSFE